MNLAQLKAMCAANVADARGHKAVAHQLINEAGTAAADLLSNRKLLLTEDEAFYLPVSIRGQEVYCHGFDPHQIKQDIGVMVSPYLSDGRIGGRAFCVSVAAIDRVVD